MLTISKLSDLVATSMSNVEQINLESFKEMSMNLLGTAIMGRRSSVGRAGDS